MAIELCAHYVLRSKPMRDLLKKTDASDVKSSLDDEYRLNVGFKEASGTTAKKKLRRKKKEGKKNRLPTKRRSPDVPMVKVREPRFSWHSEFSW